VIDPYILLCYKAELNELGYHSMKKLRNSISADLKPLIIYEDELLEIYSFLKEICDENIIIKTCGYELDTINEIKELPVSKTHEIRFECNQPYLHIELLTHSANIYCGDTGIEAEGVVARAKEVLSKGERKTTGIHNHPWLSFFIGIPLMIGLFKANWPLAIIGIILIFTTSTIFFGKNILILKSILQSFLIHVRIP